MIAATVVAPIVVSPIVLARIVLARIVVARIVLAPTVLTRIVVPPTVLARIVVPPTVPARIVLASASSKTAFATAHELATRSGRPELIGLTSHREFTEGLGLYDRVLGYDEVAALPDGSVFVDMAGADPVMTSSPIHVSLQPL